jgi:hypothetical protein
MPTITHRSVGRESTTAEAAGREVEVPDELGGDVAAEPSDARSAGASA